jgi:hypothetical protein
MPDRFYIDKDDRQYYEKLTEDNFLNFKDKSQREQFLLAMAVGYENERKHVLKSREGFFFSSYMPDKTLINSLAINEKGTVDVLADEKEVFNIAEQYASGGVRFLVDAINQTQFGSYDKYFEKELFDSYAKFIKSQNSTATGTEQLVPKE